MRSATTWEAHVIREPRPDVGVYIHVTAGRMYVRAWAQPVGLTEGVMTLPTPCPGEGPSTVKLCSYHDCCYELAGAPQTRRGFGWVVIEVEAPLVIDPAPVNTP